MAPKSKKNASKFASKFEAENHPKIEPKWKQHGGNMEPKRHQKFNVFLVRFWNGSGNIDGAAGGLRGGCVGSASGALSPADPPGRPSRARGYQTKTGKEGWLGGSNTPRAVGPANSKIIFGSLWGHFG